MDFYQKDSPKSKKIITQRLESAKEFFEKLGYEIFFQPEGWNEPKNYKSLRERGLLMFSSDKVKMVHIHPDKFGLSIGYFIIIKLTNYDVFLKNYRTKENLEKVEFNIDSGF
jgi:hypothetical protein